MAAAALTGPPSPDQPCLLRLSRLVKSHEWESRGREGGESAGQGETRGQQRPRRLDQGSIEMEQA